ncbi:hypothetical protein [Fluviicola chungangensis]|uniref:DUF4870 domain-containing protein n=1 Tax=Fluviicola chungangensis TaxID=2597671 RepID=A0A556MRI0_9FLAO|nr:hypothetical protein [Fluviicola chungangensis]TSJ42503.1 hypothetical protein FO442_12105 [Fluviicola chungangensis]
MNSKPFNKTYAIVAYCTLIGWIVSLIRVSSLTGEERSFTAFHLRQMLILMLFGSAVSIVNTVLFFLPYFGFIVINILSFMLFICWLLGLIASVRGKQTGVSFVIRAAENMLGDMFE